MISSPFVFGAVIPMTIILLHGRRSRQRYYYSGNNMSKLSFSRKRESKTGLDAGSSPA
jgi:hypothetical protein